MNPIRIERNTPRNPAEIRTELDSALAASRELRMGTIEYRAHRLRIGSLLRELAIAEPVTPAAFTADDYKRFPDTFEQMGRNQRQ